MSDQEKSQGIVKVPWYKSTKKTMGVFGGSVLYISFILVVLGWVKNGMPVDGNTGLIGMAQIVALYSAAMFGIKSIGGAIINKGQ